MTTFYVLFNGHFHFITSDVLNLNNFNHHTKKADVKFVSRDADECVERCEFLNSRIKIK